jgi:hypothetical protein
LNIKPLDHGTADSDRLRRVPISDPLRQSTLVVGAPYGSDMPDNVRNLITVMHKCQFDEGAENIAVGASERTKDIFYSAPIF